jgi:hypothetical protein
MESKVEIPEVELELTGQKNESPLFLLVKCPFSV